MIREYIGARYVPKFMGEYDATQQYDALSVVDNGLGTTYISKVPTPPGTSLDNRDFWIVFGSSSGAIVNLQNQIDTINAVLGSLSDLTTSDTSTIVAAINSVLSDLITIIGDLSDLDSSVTTDIVSAINSVISDINGIIGSLDQLSTTDKTSIVNAINEVVGNIGNLSSLNTPVKTSIVDAINSMTNRKYICVSDSYGTYPGPTNNWMAKLAYFIGADSSNFFSRAYSGSGFATGGETFQQQVQAIESGMTAQEKLEITDIIVGGGFNDAQISPQDNVYIAMQNFKAYCAATFPNAKIHIGFIGWSFNSEWISRLRQYDGLAYYQNAPMMGMSYVEGSECCLHNKDLFTQEPQGDTSLYLGYFYGHPNIQGANNIATCFANHLIGGCGVIRNWPQYALVTPTLASGVSVLSGSAAFYMEQQDDVISVIKDDLNNTIFGFSTPQNIVNGLTIELGKMESGFIAGIDSAQAGARPLSQIPFFGEVWDGSAWKLVMGSLLFMNNRIYARVVHPDVSAAESLCIFSAGGTFPAKCC
jgi:hypothetical protein